MKNIAIKAIVFYKKISLVLRETRFPLFIYTDCKFYPTCSDYTLEMINKYGAVRGLMKSFDRILRCSPFSREGVDVS